MPFTDSTLFTIRGRVREFRPGVNESQVDAWINDRIMQAVQYRTYWSDLIVKGILSIPNAYTTGTVSVTTGSNIVTGVGCNFPVRDIVNATIPQGVPELGYQDVFPNTMAGISYRSILYADAAGTPEAVPVVQVLGQFGFNGSFQLNHNPGCSITQSSLAGQQLRLGYGSPIFTVLAVIDAETILLDQPWGGAPLSGQAYQIYRVYYDFGTNMQELFYVLDQQQGLPLQLHTPVRSANIWDPQRTNYGPPTNVVDAQPSANGIIQSEIWPHQVVAYQLQYATYQNWPKLVNDTDRPPWFMDPALWYHGALADALRYRKGKEDPYHNPKLADSYESRFVTGLQQASNADEAKVMRELSGMMRVMYPGGANFDQSHDYDMWNGLF